MAAAPAGCAHTFDATTLGVPATLSSPAAEPPQGTRFSVTSRAVYAAWGLIKLREPSLRKALAAQLTGGTGLADVRIRVRSRWTDVLLTGLTLGLLVPRAVTFEGVVTGAPAVPEPEPAPAPPPPAGERRPAPAPPPQR